LQSKNLKRIIKVFPFERADLHNKTALVESTDIVPDKGGIEDQKQRMIFDYVRKKTLKASNASCSGVEPSLKNARQSKGLVLRIFDPLSPLRSLEGAGFRETATYPDKGTVGLSIS
jgi:hypothetical protein